jgi:hypothetical protein
MYGFYLSSINTESMQIGQWKNSAAIYELQTTYPLA